MDTSPWIILVLVGIGFAGVVAFFYTLSKTTLYRRELHDLTVKSHQLRNTHIQKLIRLRSSDAWDDAELVLAPSIEDAIGDAEENPADEVRQAA